jgi:hypothetical protein
VTVADTKFQRLGKPNVHCDTRSTAPEVSVVRHAEVFVVGVKRSRGAAVEAPGSFSRDVMEAGRAREVG